MIWGSLFLFYFLKKISILDNKTDEYDKCEKVVCLSSLSEESLEESLEESSEESSEENKDDSEEEIDPSDLFKNL